MITSVLKKFGKLFDKKVLVQAMDAPAFNSPPPMRQTMGGKKPIAASILVFDDLSGSSQTWGVAIEQVTENMVSALEASLAKVTWGYLGMRDQDVGEEDEPRLEEGTGTELLREQKAATREGGGDPDETFAWSVERAEQYYPFGGGSEVSKAMIVFETSSTKLLKSGRSLRDLGAALAKRRIYLFVVGTPGSNMKEMSQGAGQYGFFFELDANPGTREANKLAERLTATIKSSIGPGATTVRGDTVPSI